MVTDRALGVPKRVSLFKPACLAPPGRAESVHWNSLSSRALASAPCGENPVSVRPAGRRRRDAPILTLHLPGEM